MNDAVYVELVGMTIPKQKIPGLAAFAWVKLMGPGNFAVYVRNLSLMFENQRYYVRMPAEVKKVPCGFCETRNILNANFCNGCGGKLVPTQARSSYVDLFAPDNTATREMIVRALVIEFEWLSNQGTR